MHYDRIINLEPKTLHSNQLWDLTAEILTELSRRDNVKYQVRASKESLDDKFKQLRIGTT